MEKRKLALIGIIIVLIIAVIALIGTAFTGFSIKQKDSTVSIAWIGPLTGESATTGRENLNGISVAVDRINSQGGINGKKVVLTIQDDKYDPKETINAYNKLVNENKVKFLLIDTYGGYLALNEQAKKDNVIIIDSIDATKELSNKGNNSFAIGIYDESIGQSIADYINKNDSKKVGIITNNQAEFTLLVQGAFKEKYKGNLDEESYNFGLTDFRSILTKLSDEDFIVLNGFDETGRAVKQAHELGINSTIIGIDTFATDNFKRNTGNSYEGLIFTFWQGSSNNPKFNEFILDYKNKYGKEPDNILFASVGNDAIGALMDSISKCNNEDVNCIKFRLMNLKNYQGSSGNITMDSDGITRSIKETMFTYKNGKAISLD